MTANNYQPPTANEADEHKEEVPNPTPPDTHPPPPPALLNVKISNSGGEELHFKMKPTTKLGKAKSHYCDRFGRTPQSLRFLFEGQRILDDSTPQSLEMYDGDMIEVHEEQIGGGIEMN